MNSLEKRPMSAMMPTTTAITPFIMFSKSNQPIIRRAIDAVMKTRVMTGGSFRRKRFLYVSFITSPAAEYASLILSLSGFSSSFLCGLRKSAQRAGERVSALIAERPIDIAIVRPNWR